MISSIAAASREAVFKNEMRRCSGRKRKGEFPFISKECDMVVDVEVNMFL